MTPAPAHGRRLTRSLASWFLALWWMIVVLAPMAAAAPADNERCLRCHGEGWIAERRPEALAAMVRAPADGKRVLRAEADIPALHLDAAAWQASAHGAMACDQCHPGIDTLPHGQVVAAVACAACHVDAANHQQAGRHAAGNPNAPACTDCHGNAHAVDAVDGPRTYAAALAMVDRCSKCHTDVGEGKFSPSGTFHDSIHGEALFKKGLVQGPVCSDCHGTHQILAASDPASPVSHANAATTCGACHQGVAQTYADSVHGQRLAAGHDDAATCTSCHHSHGIQRVGPEFLGEVVAECSHCHLELGKSYLLSYHGKASELGRHDVAVCSSCHGAHDILPAKDPKSRVAHANLKATCGECHPGANDNFVSYIAHVDLSGPDANPVVFYIFWGMTILLCSVLAVFVPHSLLWFQRSIMDRLRGGHNHHGPTRMVRRFSPLHRVTHALIIISFMGLVATGFPLKYSYAPWAHELSAWFGGIRSMGLLHRLFAVVTFGYAAVHFAWLIHFFVWKCPSPRWRYVIGPNSMMFSLKDLWDFLAMVRWFFRRGPRPRFDRWAYFEKFDYWGEIWGVFVIGGTGLMLWFPTVSTWLLPGWTLNAAMVIHSIEALLAASVIFLVHFFNTHLRPEKFPIDLTMWSGQMSEAEMKEERAAEYERLVASGELEARIEKPMSFHRKVVGVVLGMTAFLFGIALIVLAIRTEILNITGLN